MLALTAFIAFMGAGLMPPTAAAQRSRPQRASRQNDPLPALLDAVRSGGPDSVVDDAIQRLVELADPRATDVLRSLTHHRRLEARRAAYLGLSRLRTDEARRVVSRGLSDPDASIRNLCARALGPMDATSELPRLFLALDRGVFDATQSIGMLGDEGDLARYHQYLERVPLRAMLDGYARFSRREDIDWDAKTETVHRLFELAGPDVRAFFQRWQDELDGNAPAAFRATLSRSIRRIRVGPAPADAAPTRAEE